MTVTLKLLGGMSLSDSSGPLTGQITQRRRLAFLAILGVSPRATASRDRLVALLWPELDGEGARHRLSDSLYVARRALGDEAIVPVGDDLRLDEERVEVDVRAFERALDAGESEQAISLYGGTLLDGFHLGGEGEFDRWVDGERARLAGRYAQALRTLASSAERRGDHGTAADCLRRLAELDPLDSRLTLQLMEALERGGNGAVALRHARIHQTLRQTELGLGEDEKVRAAEDALVARLERASAPRPAPVPVAAVALVETAVAEPLAPQPALETEHEPAAPRPQPESGPRRRPWLMVAGAVAVASVVLAVVAARRDSASRAPLVDRSDRAATTAVPGVAVFPFMMRGSDSSVFAGDALAALIATKLDGGGMRSIDPNVILARYRPGTEHPDPADAARLARSLGARYFVLGDVMQVSGRLHLGAAMYDAADGTPVDALIGVEGASAGFFELVDSLASRLLVERRGQSAPQLERLASLTTSSLPALKLFLEGESLALGGHYAEAAERYERATVADSTFALGYYRLAWTHSWMAGRGSDIPTLELAARHASRLPERIRLTLAALLAIGHGDSERGETMLRDVIDRHPDDFDANLWLGDMLFHQNPPRGRSIVEARGPLERASALAPARSAEALFHLITIAALERRVRDVDSLSTLFLALHHDGDIAAGVRLMLATTLHDSARLALARRELAGVSTRVALRLVSATTGGTSDHAAVASLLASLDTPRPPEERSEVLLAMARLACVDGRWGAADSLFVRAAASSPDDAALARARLLSLTSLDPPKAMLREARAALAMRSITTEPARTKAALLGALLALRLGETVAERPALGRPAPGTPVDYEVRALALEFSARRLLMLGKADQAIALLESPEAARPRPPLRYLRGEVLEALHRPTEALAWYDVSEQDYGGEWFGAAIARAHERLAKR